MEAFTTALPASAYTLLSLLLIALCGLYGWYRGLPRGLAGIVNIVGGALLAKPMGVLIAPFLSLDRFPTPTHALITVFAGGLIGYILVAILTAIGLRVFHLTRAWEGTAKLVVEIGGFLIGATIGTGIVVATGWYVLTVGDVAETIMGNKRMQEALANQQDISLRLLMLPTQMTGSHRDSFSRSLVGRLAAATNPVPALVTDSLTVVKEVTKNPENFRKLAESEPVQKLAAHPVI
ncbi:MAG: hypothetical protein AAB853_03025, partial [Patescibacteria group bacterium]